MITWAAWTAWEMRQIRRHHHTYSEFIYRTFHVHTPAGRVTFLLALTGGTMWLGAHVLRYELKTVAEEVARI